MESRSPSASSGQAFAPLRMTARRAVKLSRDREGAVNLALLAHVAFGVRWLTRAALTIHKLCKH